jgi:hypothetical protein
VTYALCHRTVPPYLELSHLTKNSVIPTGAERSEA